MNRLIIKRLVFVIEGFAVFTAAHALGGFFIAPQLADIFHNLPALTIFIFFSSAISPLFGILYLLFRARYFPQFQVNLTIVIYIFLGILFAFAVVSINTRLSGIEIPFAQELLREPPPYRYLNSFLVIFWIPFIEEILNRGYFFEILKKCMSNFAALMVSSLFFVIPHGIWESFSLNLIFIFINSVIYTWVYLRGGLIASSSVHIFVNSYLLLLNI